MPNEHLMKVQKLKPAFITVCFKDFDKMIPPLVQNNGAAYYFIRLDTISEMSGHNWLLITYIPDEATVNRYNPLDK